jgi:ribonuclease J
MYAYEYRGQILVVDSGLMFPTNDMLGIDYLIPDFQYLIDHRDRVRGIVITHGHEDHTGAIAHLMQSVQAPIYATPLTMGLVEVKLGKARLGYKPDLHTVHAGDTVQIGPFKVTFYHVTHSIPDAVGLGIDTPAGLIVHSGDYKFDQSPVDGWPSDYGQLVEFGRRGVLALMADSTNAERPGWTPSEKAIEPAFEQVFSEAKGRIFVACFASAISRIQQVADIARQHGRKITFQGMSMVDNTKMARTLGYLKIPDDQLVTLDRALAMKDDQVLILCTGSQGEPTSVMGRLSNGALRQLSIKPGDTVVLSAHPIPGNEENVSRTINSLFAQGANVIYDPIASVHVSGHASQEEIKMLIHLTNPRYLIPMHGELRHLHQHAHLAQQLGMAQDHIQLVENGQVVEFENGQMRLGERLPSSTIYVEGTTVADVGPEVIRERESLAKDGVVMVHLSVSKKNHKLQREPEILSRGFIVDRDGDQLLAQARKRIHDAVARSDGNLTKLVEQTLGNYFYSETRRRPTIFVTVSEA